MAKRKALTLQQAQDIRALYATGKYLQKEIAEQYGVLTKSISQICNNETLTGAPRKKPVPTAEAEVTYRGMASDTKLLTDSGWKVASEVTLEDKLVAVDGTYTGIASIQVEEPSPLFKLTFCDNVNITTAADHRWLTQDQKNGWRKNEWLLKTSKRLGDLTIDHHIPTCKAVPGNAYTGEDPYVIGLLLGDGSTVPNISRTTLYSQDDFILNYMVVNFGWTRKKYGDQVARVYATNQRESERWKDACGRGKAHFKFVPPHLLQADRETRLSVLQGLLDTDGSADKDGRISFASASDRLSADVRYLARSLGGRSNSALNGRETTALGGGPYYKTTITPCGKFIPFRLPRKVDRCKPMAGVNRALVSVEPVGSGPTIAIVVNSPTHQLIAQDFIVVHDATGIPSCRKLPVK